MRKRGAGYLVVSAYTGVASAPFGGPTLLALMSLSITCKSARDVKQLSDVAVAAARAKFSSECGVSLDDIGGIVIDEVSFITAAVFGHVDHMLRVRGSTHSSPMPTPTPIGEHPCPRVSGDDGQLARAMRRRADLAVWRQPSKAASGRRLLVQAAGGEPAGCGCQEQAWRRGPGRWRLQCTGVRHQAAQERTQGGVGEAHASRRGTHHGSNEPPIGIQPSEASACFRCFRICRSSECSSACAIRPRAGPPSVPRF